MGKESETHYGGKELQIDKEAAMSSIAREVNVNEN